MELTVGAILEGKVKSITNFGAFVALPENKTGMVHISEVANAYVSDIRQHLTEGQDVKVMVIGNEGGKINLSIKRLEPREPRQQDRAPGAIRQPRVHQERPGNRPPRRDWEAREDRPQESRPQRAPIQSAAPKTADQLFEEKLKAFMSESDSKLSGIRADHRTKSRRR